MQKLIGAAPVAVLFSATAIAADSPPVPPVTGTSEIGNYCIYGNLIYSFGAGLCLGKGGGLVCVPSMKDQIDVAGRGYWSQGPEIAVGGRKYIPPTCP